MPDGERIGLGRVVFHDRAKVLQHQEARTQGARRREQVGLVLPTWKRLAADPANAGTFPFPHGQHARTVGKEVVEARRHHHLVAPGLAHNPAVLLEVVRGRGNDIGNRVDDVAPAISIEVYREALE